MRKAVATDMAALNKHGYEVVSNCLPENRSIRFTLLMLRQKNPTFQLGFLLLRQRDSLAQSLLDCARRLRRRTLRCTLHYASKLARSRCKANLSFSKTRGAEEMFVAKQQLTSLSPPKKPDGTVGFLPSKERLQ